MNKTPLALWCFTLALIALLLPSSAMAHGAKAEYRLTPAVEIVASYDSGEPMGGAQVTVYSPANPSVPWLTGTCDDQGRFVFVPDPAQPGSWDVQARKAGHGVIVHVPVGDDGTTAGGSTGYSPLQAVVMGACVLWGLLGTALYCKRRKGN